MARLAVLSYHTSPLAQPGTGDGGGMNVYVRELGASLARLGHDVDVYTRRDAPGPAVVAVEPGLTVRRVPAGPAAPLTRDEFERFVPDFTAAVAADLAERGAPDAIHAHYWLSAVAGHQLKHDLGVPLVVTFHTLERVKAEALDTLSEHRAAQEAAAFACADAVLASCDVEAEQFERLYGADPGRVHVVPLGVEHAFFAPGPRAEARRALGLDAGATTLLYVGRIQELKGVDLALETLIELRARGRDACLIVVGGPSGPDGRATLAALHERVERARVIGDVSLRRAPVAPAPVVAHARGRRDARPQPLRELRPGRAGVVGLRHAGGGQRGRRAHDPRRRPASTASCCSAATPTPGPTRWSGRPTRRARARCRAPRRRWRPPTPGAPRRRAWPGWSRSCRRPSW